MEVALTYKEVALILEEPTFYPKVNAKYEDAAKSSGSAGPFWRRHYKIEGAKFKKKALIWRGPTSKWRRDHKRAHIFANLRVRYCI